MNKQEQNEYLEKYQEAKKKGVSFFPDILFKDALASLIIFIILILLAYFIGAPLEARANPADTTYTPRPEWYFLFLFQLLKYFPGQLEVIGVVVIPTLAIIFLFLLPFIDRNPKRYIANRPIIITVTSLALVGITFLTVRARMEAPPPVEVAQGDQTAALYAKNCASCHGSSITVPAGTNLHQVIAEGKHAGMPAWSGDLTTDQIDALAGFISSPGGSKLFTDNCGKCHKVEDLVSGSPLGLKSALEDGQNFQPHAGVDIPDWKTTLSPENRTTLLNFLAAPDGQRLFAINCSPCHGKSIAFNGDEQQLRQTIMEGGKHLDMPAWSGKLSDTDLDTLIKFILDPKLTPEGQALFDKNCKSCHGNNIPKGSDYEQTKAVIESGGPHQTMPVWGEVLTPDQLNALVAYTMESTKGTPVEAGQNLYAQYCSSCHGDFGEGGPNPTRQGDIIAPISSAEFLKTRDDFTLNSIISQGQPNFGMSPFGTSNGGPLSDEEIDSIVTYLRSWESKPPVELPPEIATASPSLSTESIFADLCAQCHGPNGEGGVGPSLSNQKFQDSNTDQQIFDSINKGHPSTAMIAWGDILTADQIQKLVEKIRTFREVTSKATPTTAPTPSGPTPTSPSVPSPTGPAVPSFANDVMPIFKQSCSMCHGTLGGWNATNYDSVINSGVHSPAVIPGDLENSLLAQKLLGTQKEGNIMPPGGKLADDIIQIILDWIAAGAPNN